MQYQHFTEKDWKLFRKKLPDWQEACMDRLNREYILLLSGQGSPSDKFWELDKRIREDQKMAGVQLSMRRSNLIYSLASLINEGTIDWKDMEGFSDDLKDAVKFLTSHQ